MRAISAVVGLVVLLAASAAAQDAGRPNPSLLKARFSKLPIYFVENRGVYPDEVKFCIQGADKTLFVTKEGITFRLKGKGRDWVVKLEFVGANPDVVPRGEDRQQAVFSYFRGPEKDWKTGLQTYAKVVYEDLWPGIDLVYKGTVNRLKYEFVVKPGADPRQIKLRYEGATEAEITRTGGLCVKTPAGDFQDAPPAAWQEIDGEREPVDMAFTLASATGERGLEFGFRVGVYDNTRRLILDPAILVYCGYIGGASFDEGNGIAVDQAGNAYVTGRTSSSQVSFPVTVGPDLTFNGGNLPWPVDAFVAKVSAQGTALVYCGYIGGSGDENGLGIAVDQAGNAYVTGQTSSSQVSFPVTGGPDLTHNGGTDAFVAKVDRTGQSLVYCGYIGGVQYDVGYGIAVDRVGNAYVAGETASDQKTFPVTVGPDLTLNDIGIGDAFVAKVNTQGTGLVYCGYIGGGASDLGSAIAVDEARNAYVTGSTFSSNQKTFPLKVGPDLTYNGGACDAFVAKVNAAGTGLVYCGYIGGNGQQDHGRGVALDPAGNAYVTGVTDSDQMTFPVTGGPDLTYNGGTDAFVAKVNAQGTALVYCGYIGGGIYRDFGYGIAVDKVGNAYVTGQTGSSQQLAFPVTVGPDLTYNGGTDAFVAKVALILLTGSGTTRPGGQVDFSLTATDDVGLVYHVGTSLGTGPIPIDSRWLNLSPDDLLRVTVTDLWPWIFSGYRGVIDAQGQAQAAIHIPNVPALIGVRLHSAFVTLDPAAPSGIRSISDTFTFSVTK